MLITLAENESGQRAGAQTLSSAAAYCRVRRVSGSVMVNMHGSVRLPAEVGSHIILTAYCLAVAHTLV